MEKSQDLLYAAQMLLMIFDDSVIDEAERDALTLLLESVRKVHPTFMVGWGSSFDQIREVV